MEKLTLYNMFRALRLENHKEMIDKIIDKVDLQVREELIKYLNSN